MYKDKIIYVATKHKKERAIKQPFGEKLSSIVKVIDDFDTDLFGTFSGEVERTLSPYETCIAKAKMASEKFNHDYVVSSEGSFGPHPALYFIPADIEILVFFDAEKNIVIHEHLISTETNYAHLDLHANDDYKDFLKKIKFPSHKLILKDTDGGAILGKGIDDVHQLAKLIKRHQNNQLRLETDMRAMCNPTRMKNIKKLALQLASRISQICPSCHYPGFGKIEFHDHLACEACGRETELYKYKVLTCINCDFNNQEARDDGKKYANPQHCMNCNP